MSIVFNIDLLNLFLYIQFISLKLNFKNKKGGFGMRCPVCKEGYIIWNCNGRRIKWGYCPQCHNFFKKNKKKKEVRLIQDLPYSIFTKMFKK